MTDSIHDGRDELVGGTHENDVQQSITRLCIEATTWKTSRLARTTLGTESFGSVLRSSRSSVVSDSILFVRITNAASLSLAAMDMGSELHSFGRRLVHIESSTSWFAGNFGCSSARSLDRAMANRQIKRHHRNVHDSNWQSEQYQFSAI